MHLVRARVLWVFLLVFQGSVAAGSALWGALGQRAGVSVALQWAGLGAVASVCLGLFFKLPNTSPDTSPWNPWHVPDVMNDLPAYPGEGPALVMVEFAIPSGRRAHFEMLIKRYGRVRRRDGASRLEIFRDMEIAGRCLEVFLVASWAEHLRQHERQTRADDELVERSAKVC